MIARPWGNLPNMQQPLKQINWRHLPLPQTGHSLLAYGLGRSYGDSCLNIGNDLLSTLHLDHLITFDTNTGIIRAEAGMQLWQIAQIALPHGYFLPVTPGTRFVTLGGAIANDVHGKNHHTRGSFGQHVRAFELLRSNGERLLCSPQQNSELYAATIGGLGLTGMITWVEMALQPVVGNWLETQTLPFVGLNEFFALSEESDQSWEYTVSWVDCSRKSELRGLFMRGCFVVTELPATQNRRLGVPCYLPNITLNPLTISAFNRVYYHWGRRRSDHRQLASINSFFYPLDGLAHWNRIYGRRGFYQYQFVLPSSSQEAIAPIFKHITSSEQGSFLAVLKMFGQSFSAGMLSFPLSGVTLALDFANQGQNTVRLFEYLDQMVREAGGRIYPAKDARMGVEIFRSGYPKWQQFTQYIDPAFSSSFWRRVGGKL